MIVKKKKLILIGASTGGPGHLKNIFLEQNSSFSTPVVIAQHMNEVFIDSFVNQFDKELPFNFSATKDGCPIEENGIYICSTHSLIIKSNCEALLLHSNRSEVSHYNPSIDSLFFSVVNLCKNYDILAILLTGIGQDGAEGLSALKNAGATCVAESKESAIVFGMPKRAIELNREIRVMSLNEITAFIKRFDN